MVQGVPVETKCKHIQSMKFMTRDRAIFFCGIIFYPAAVLLLQVFLGKPVRRHLLFVGLFFLLVILEWVGWEEKSARDWFIRLVAYSGLFTFPLFGLDPKAEINRLFPVSDRGSEKTQKLFDWIGMLVFLRRFNCLRLPRGF